MKAPLRLPTIVLTLLLASSGCDDATAPAETRILSISPTVEFLDIGESVTLTAAAPGDTSLSGKLNWKSSDPTIAEVTGGITTGKAPGTATITVQAPGFLGSVTVTVRKPVDKLVVMPRYLKLIQGREAKLHVELLDESGQLVQRPVRFSAPADASVSVDTGGVVSTRSLGSATVTVTVGAKSRVVPVEVVTGERETVTELVGISPTDLNNLGWVVGSANGRGMLWRDHEVTEIHPPGYQSSAAHRVNDRGQIAGVGLTASGTWTIWIWSRGTFREIPLGSPPDLGAPIGRVSVTGLNSRGELVGMASTAGVQPSLENRPFHWDGNRLNWLPAPRNIYYSASPAINDAGVIFVGESLIRGGEVSTLSIPSNWSGTPLYWLSYDINNHDEIAGSAYRPTLGGYSFRGPPDALDYHTANVIGQLNDYRDAVGTVVTTVACSTVCRAVLWRAGRGWRRLDEGRSDYFMGSATRINELGQILVEGRRGSTPAPESGWLLLEPAS